MAILRNGVLISGGSNDSKDIKYNDTTVKDELGKIKLATATSVGLVKPDGETCEVDENGTLTVTSTGDENLAFKQSEVEQAIADGRIVDGDIFDVTDDDVPQAWTSTQIEHTTSSGSKTSVGAELINLNSNIVKNNIGTKINISAYTSTSNKYTFPCDGYLTIWADTSKITGVTISGADENTNQIAFVTKDGVSNTLFVKSGMKVYHSYNQGGSVSFAPLIQ